MIYLFLNGEVPLKSDFFYTQPSKVIAVDGGADKIPESLTEDIIIGDLDSIRAKPKVEVIKHPVDKDKSDFELALEYISKFFSHKKLVVFGLTGGRFDHQLFNLFLLKDYSDSFDIVCETENESIYVTKGNQKIKGCKEKSFSIFPLEDLESLSITGAKYPLENKKVYMGETLTLSNICTSESLNVYSDKVVATIINK
ncbi:thiamine diphosphokinase [Proteinivorax hydrogeniformans]|uniref:Thiamine diphosphokinase n=1 Tax=Proteinivorax hydrogeniformans TaxID=1826727 RepID=A0AAU8HQT5_9FIRM